jgi:hypothetical protein
MDAVTCGCTRNSICREFTYGESVRLCQSGFACQTRAEFTRFLEDCDEIMKKVFGDGMRREALAHVSEAFSRGNFPCHIRHGPIGRAAQSLLPERALSILDTDPVNVSWIAWAGKDR